MKVLVTGAGGLLGRHVVHALFERGIAVVALGRHRPVALTAAQFVPCDMLREARLDDLLRSCGATHLVHLAWETGHGAYWESAVNLRWVDASLRLVEAFVRAGGRHVVVAGSCAEYDWSVGGLCAEEDTPLLPATLYGVAKDATRRLLQAWCARHRVGFAWARVFFPVGEGEDPRRLVPMLVAALRGTGEPLGVNAATRRDFLHADDVAAALLALLHPLAHGAYNVGSGVATPIGDVVELLADQLGADAQTVLSLPSRRAPGPGVLVADNRRLRSLGWTQRLTLQQALARSIAAPTSGSWRAQHAS
jgi:nucleoside-diphosphate-sugar epimerase